VTTQKTVDFLKSLDTYEPDASDNADHFYNNWLIYICWENHLMYCAPFCVPLPPSLPFGALVGDLMPELYGEHPEFEQIDWQRTKWFDSDKQFRADFGKSLEHHGLRHKSLIRFNTPALEGSRVSKGAGQQGF